MASTHIQPTLKSYLGAHTQGSVGRPMNTYTSTAHFAPGPNPVQYTHPGTSTLIPNTYATNAPIVQRNSSVERLSTGYAPNAYYNAPQIYSGDRLPTAYPANPVAHYGNTGYTPYTAEMYKTGSIGRASTNYTASPVVTTPLTNNYDYAPIFTPNQRFSTETVPQYANLSVERPVTAYAAPVQIANMSVERPVTTYAAPVQTTHLSVERPSVAYTAPYQTNFRQERPSTAYTTAPTGTNYMNTTYAPQNPLARSARTSTAYTAPLAQNYATTIPNYTAHSVERSPTLYQAPLVNNTGLLAPQQRVTSYVTPVRTATAPVHVNILDAPIATTAQQAPVEIVKARPVNQNIQPVGEETVEYHEFVSGAQIEPWTRTETRPVTKTNFKEDGRGGVHPISDTRYEEFHTTVHAANGGVRTVKPVKTFRTYELGTLEI